MTGPLMPGSILSMPAAAAERLIRLDSGDAALLYLYLLGHGNAAGPVSYTHLTLPTNREV